MNTFAISCQRQCRRAHGGWMHLSDELQCMSALLIYKVIYKVTARSLLLQGVAALMALNSLELEGDLKKKGWGSAEHLHAAIESMRLGFVDTLQYNADPQVPKRLMSLFQILIGA